MKCALSLDGKIAFEKNTTEIRENSSEEKNEGKNLRENLKWITSEKSRNYVHEKRAEAQVRLLMIFSPIFGIPKKKFRVFFSEKFWFN